MVSRKRILVVGSVVLAVIGALLGWWWFLRAPQGVEPSVADQLVEHERVGDLRYLVVVSPANEPQWLEGAKARATYEEERAALLANPSARVGQITPYFTNGSSTEQDFPFGYASTKEGAKVAVAPGMAMWAIRFEQPAGGYVEAYWEGPPPK